MLPLIHDTSCSNLEAICKDTLQTNGLAYPKEFVYDIKQQLSNHKNCERQRRERLRCALDQLQKRLPPQMLDYQPECKVSKPKRKHVICKAATVEAATAYIALLEQRLEESTRPQ